MYMAHVFWLCVHPSFLYYNKGMLLTKLLRNYIQSFNDLKSSFQNLVLVSKENLCGTHL